jgi:hypothetical protein
VAKNGLSLRLDKTRIVTADHTGTDALRQKRIGLVPLCLSASVVKSFLAR